MVSNEKSEKSSDLSTLVFVFISVYIFLYIFYCETMAEIVILEYRPPTMVGVALLGIFIFS